MNASRGTIAILTGGGDVPGLNPAIRAVTFRALREGYRVLGIRRGWAGLVDLVPPSCSADRFDDSGTVGSSATADVGEDVGTNVPGICVRHRYTGRTAGRMSLHRGMESPQTASGNGFPGRSG